MNRGIAALVVAALVVAAPSAFAGEHLGELSKARCLKCEFDAGTHTSWDGGLPKSAPTRFGKQGSLTFDAIDLTARTARLIAGGATDVLALPTPAGLTFVEETGTGNLIITTVFANYDTPGSGRFVAVMSRHIALSISGPMPSQFHGTCSIVDNPAPSASQHD